MLLVADAQEEETLRRRAFNYILSPRVRDPNPLNTHRCQLVVWRAGINFQSPQIHSSSHLLSHHKQNQPPSAASFGLMPFTTSAERICPHTQQEPSGMLPSALDQSHGHSGHIILSPGLHSQNISRHWDSLLGSLTKQNIEAGSIW